MCDRYLENLHRLYPELAAGAELPEGPLPRIQLRFAETFARWMIRLPEEGVVARRRGKIVAEGWAIWYLFDRDAEGEFLDYYSCHRMTGDEHVRLREDGSEEHLDALRELRIMSPDPEEDKRWEREFDEENRRVAEMLAAKGFCIEGDEPGSAIIHRFLLTGGMDD